MLVPIKGGRDSLIAIYVELDYVIRIRLGVPEAAGTETDRLNKLEVV